LAENLELDCIVAGNIDEAMEHRETVAEAETCEFLLDGAVSGERWIAEKRKYALEFGVAWLGCADVVDKLGFGVGSVAEDRRELKLARLEESARGSIGRFTPL
jgi:hypothetical protein